MRRLISLGLVALGATVFFTQACGGSDGGATFSNDAGAKETGTPSSSGGFNTEGGVNPTGDDDDEVQTDGGPINDATAPICGNGILDPNETCDDGNKTANDGCSDTCQTEANYVCNVPGTPCAKLGGCGDGQINNGEDCDDKNTVSNDGCSATCKIEPGWICPIPAVACTAAECGDGLVAGKEECDDKNKKSGDGCSSTCTIEDGFKCPNAGQSCSPTTCGDNKKEGTEQCDDGNLTPYDGCSPTCTKEPTCPKTGGACTDACGDGIVFPGEDCDDGNTKDGDGCSSTCKVEQGYKCSPSTDPLPQEIDQPIIYRDFSRGDKEGVCAPNGCANGHPDFDTYSGSVRGIPGLLFNNGDATKTGVLDAEGKPQYKCTLGDGANCTVTSKDTYAQWYRDLPGNGTTTRVNYSFNQTLPLTKQADGTYQYDSNGSNFFPIDGKGFGNQYKSSTDCGGDHNFHFTSELRFWFQYDQSAIDNPPEFDFTGDDDVYVFINGKLAVDIGGVHNAESSSVTLNATNAGLLQLAKGQIYEFALFQAERNRCASDYKATFKGFARAKSVCVAQCGDGFQTPDEACDDGKNNDTNVPPAAPAYGKCSSDCKSRGPYCGDGTLQNPPEKCDDGAFNGGYDKCKVDCSGPGPKCGDGVIDTIYGELCDDGGNNDTNVPPAAPAYGKCSSDCRSRPRCGDGIVNGNEQCDGAPIGGQACTASCTLSGGPK